MSSGRKFSRLLSLPKKSFFLFGARGVGKSTWLKEALPKSQRIDLLHHRTYLELSREPSLLEEWVEPSRSSWPIIIDEVQKVPAILDEVHRLIEDRGWKFALSGSSARKLRRSGANLLAGRAHVLSMEGLSAHEMKDNFDLDLALRFGLLPLVAREAAEDPSVAQETLEAYVHTYLKEEIQAEGTVRKIDPFLRFLEVAGLLNGQITHIENIAREARVPRASVHAYFSILEDTLLAHRLPSYQPGAKVREVAHSKHFWFDPGVARAAAGRIREPLDEISRGVSLETLIYHELRIYNEVSRKKKKISYYRTGSGDEIDFIIELAPKIMNQKARVICLEVKASGTWDKRWEKPIVSFSDAGKVNVAKAYGVYLGRQALHRERITVLPFGQFIDALFSGEVF